MSGPLAGVRVIELAGLGPAPFAAMVLADLGADVVRVDRFPGHGRPGTRDAVLRGRRSIAVDLKAEGAADVVLRLVESADAVIEGFRPGVADRLGVGYTACEERNPRIVYGHVTGWGQDGPLADAAGHDINYLALTGVLDAIGRAGSKPTPPLNLVGDFAGGGLLLALGIVCALFEAQRSGRGQEIDAAMVDGVALLAAMFYVPKAGAWGGPRGTNLLDSGAHFYEVYECADGRHLSVGAIEPAFHRELLDRLGLDGPEWDEHRDPARWVDRKDALAAVFAQRTRDEWCRLLEGTDACVAGVLAFDEAPAHPHNVARGTFVQRDGTVEPAPRFSRTPAALGRPAPRVGEHTAEILGELGMDRSTIAALERRSVVAGCS